MAGLSPERALLMEIALELLGNTVYDIHGMKKDNLIELFKENTFPGQGKVTKSPPLHATTTMQSSVQHPYPIHQHPLKFAIEDPFLQQHTWEDSELHTSLENLHQAKEKDDKDFVDFMLKKIEIEYSNLMKASSKKRQSYFLDFWVRAVNNNESPECPDISEEDVGVIAQEYFMMEKGNLESQCKEYKEKIIEMKRSAASEEEMHKIKRIAEKIALVKKALEESIRNPSNDF